MYFLYFVSISPWKEAWPFISTNLNTHPPRMLCAKFVWNWPCCSWEEDFWISSMYFRYFVIIPPCKGRGPTFEQNWIYFIQWFWRRRFWNFILNIFLLFCYYLPLEKGMVLHLKKLESTSPKDALCQLPSLFEIGLLVLKEKKNMWKVYDKTMTTDNGQIVIRKAHLNLWLRWANKIGNKFSPITGYTT